MAVISTEFATLYAQEFTQQYENRQSVLRGMVNTRGIAGAEKFTFIVESRASAAKERGANGDIPLADSSDYTVQIGLKEYHHLIQRNNFDIVRAPVDYRMSMQRQGITSINQTTDQLILTEMANTTYATNGGSATAVDMELIMEALETLITNEVPLDGKIYCLLTPRAWSKLLKIKEFSSGDWVDDRPFMKGYQMKNWLGVKFMMHSRLQGIGTNSAKCFMWHESAVGHAINGGDIRTAVGYEEKQDRSWTRATSYQGTKLILPTGCVMIKSDDTSAI